MSLAIMQPYFLPYLGYFALLEATGSLLLFDDIQYIRHGWINRNRILHPKEGWQYVQVPLHAHARESKIREVAIDGTQPWAERLLGQLAHYKRRAPGYAPTVALLREALSEPTSSIVELNARLLRRIAAEIGISGPIEVFSSLDLPLRPVRHAGDWALAICELLGARRYVNPSGGAALFRPEEFAASGVELVFLSMREVTYSQRRQPFEPWLSIVDVLMFVPWPEIRGLVRRFELLTHAEAGGAREELPVAS